MEVVLKQLGTQTSYHVGEPSEIAAVRRASNDLGRRAGFSDVRAGELAIVVTEAATNIVKHAERGHILLRRVACGPANGVEVIALDSGPGMSNVNLSMRDGESSAGTYGVGLGAIRRLSHEFDLYTAPHKGSVLLMTIWDDPAPVPALRWQVGAVCLPLPGETACGDAFGLHASDKYVTLAVVDGLGHGPIAAEAAERALATMALAPTRFPADQLTQMHAAMHGTRGAAVALAHIDPAAGALRFAGVGNIAGSVYTGQARRHLLSHNGIVGSNLRKVQEFAEAWPRGGILILHSDGLGTRWDLAAYPGLAGCAPGVIAGVLYRDFARGRDDATVVVVSEYTDQ